MWEEEHCHLGKYDWGSDSYEPLAIKLIIGPDKQIWRRVSNSSQDVFLWCQEAVEDENEYEACIDKLSHKNVGHNSYVVVRPVSASLSFSNPFEDDFDVNLLEGEPASDGRCS